MSDKSTHSKILILDFGSQYTQVIARRIRECQVYSEIIRFNTPAAEIAALKPNGLILSGGPASVYDRGAPQIDPNIFSLGVPVLGICYGLMLMANHLGGRVVFSGRREYGAGVLHVKNGSELLGGLGKQLDVWNRHGDEVTALPKGFRVAGTFQMGSNSDVRHGDGAVWKDSKRFAFCGTASTANLDEVEISPVDLR